MSTPAKLTNITGIPLMLAVWLAADGYDFKRGDRKAISATSLLQGVRKILLNERLDDTTREPVDVMDRFSSRRGHTIHDGVERAWHGDFKASMRALGYPESIISRMVINPEEVTGDMLPIYIEQRAERDFAGYAVTGKFDMIIEGVLQDIKTTSTYSYTSGKKEEDYRLQGSIYRWLNPEKVTADHMMINFIFSDFQKYDVRPGYPTSPVMGHRVDLLSISETENWMRNKFRQLEEVAHLPEAELPFCTDEELWRTDPVWKYYSNPAKAQDPSARSTKNFTTALAAQAFMAEKGGKGIIVEVPGKVRACHYCAARPICTQKDLYDLS